MWSCSAFGWILVFIFSLLLDDTTAISRMVEKPTQVLLPPASDINSTFRLNPDALEVLRNLDKPIMSVAMTGNARMGKSFWMGAIARHAHNYTGDLFEVSDFAEPKTLGAWVIPIKLEKGSLLLWDTEGQGALGTNLRSEQMSAFISLFVSRSVYMVRVVINNNDLDWLERIRSMQRFLHNDPAFLLQMDYVITGPLEGATRKLQETIQKFLEEDSLWDNNSRVFELKSPPPRNINDTDVVKNANDMWKLLGESLKPLVDKDGNELDGPGLSNLMNDSSLYIENGTLRAFQYDCWSQMHSYQSRIRGASDLQVGADAKRKFEEFCHSPRV
jgi:hypothetical protein